MRADFVADYTAVLLALIIGVSFVFLGLFVSNLLAPRRFTPSKAAPYECGMLPIGAYSAQVHVRYYLFAILFMIFDVETVFLYPWAVVFGKMGVFAFVEMVIFITILFFGLLYAWRKGVLQWR